MSAEELLDRFMAPSKVGDPIDWQEMREQILAEHEKAPDEKARVLFLELHRALLDTVERQELIEPHDREKFRKLWEQEYVLLLLREAMIGQTGDYLDPFKVLPITTREVRDGRLSPDNDLHRQAVDTVRKLRSWFK